MSIETLAICACNTEKKVIIINFSFLLHDVGTTMPGMLPGASKFFAFSSLWLKSSGSFRSFSGWYSSSFLELFLSSSSEEFASKNVGVTGTVRSGPWGKGILQREDPDPDVLFVSAIISSQITWTKVAIIGVVSRLTPHYGNGQNRFYPFAPKS